MKVLVGKIYKAAIASSVISLSLTIFVSLIHMNDHNLLEHITFNPLLDLGT